MRKTATLFFSGLAFLAIAAFGCSTGDAVTRNATLNAANEVPPVAGITTTATYSVTFDGPQAKYTLTIASPGLTAITGAHIHTGLATATGGIWVFLFDGPTTDATVPFTGKLGVGSFTQDMVTACTGCDAARSYNGIRDGAAANPSTMYVNVHTTANPSGAIRGQLQ